MEDRRGQPLSAGSGGGGAALLLLRVVPWLLRSKSGRVLLVVGVVGYVGTRLLGIDVLSMGQGNPMAEQSRPLSDEQQELAEFSAVVLAETEDTWRRIFSGMGKQYREPTLVLFSNGVRSACGTASSAVGPFYCPGDQQLYLDLTFFNELRRRHGAPGDFAQAYVIAHEVGHHVQTLLGISQRVRQARSGLSQADANALSVRQELQADCFAGVWGHEAGQKQLLEEGDLEEALAAANAIGDDTLQEQAGRAVVPDSFTHGSSAQRVEWFRRGFDSGDISACDTFAR
ncbi:YpfJ-like protein [Alcanivorax xiamenensis]|uniref:YpfJ-like protein n=1 Tax=Alcanivorax xiamenensis TaxID=1177156 RepID=A0ABQ6Y523_9GAMM|nr:YpfJ-like protein [Alcanivorax xiamenensis]